MSEKDVPDAPEPEVPEVQHADTRRPEPGQSEAQRPQAPAPGKSHAKPHEHFIPPGPESTRELREMARRRREAEEKLQQHLLEVAKLEAAKEKPGEE